MTAWLLALLVCAGLILLHRRRRRLQKRILRTHEHEVALEMLDDWLTSVDIQKALVTTGTVTLDGLETLHEKLSGMGEPEVIATIAALTRDRRVRRVISAHVAQKFGDFPRAYGMKALGELNEWGSGKR